MKKSIFFLSLALLYSTESFTMNNNITIQDKTFSLSISHDQIAGRIQALGAQITQDYSEKRLVFIGVLNGAFIFLADLVRAVDLDCEVDFLQISSYGDETQSSGKITILKDISRDITDRDIIIVEDIIDTGLSMQFLLDHLKALQPRSIRIATFLHKNIAERPFDLDYVAFEIDPEFVIGYGLDYAQLARNLKNVYKLS